MKKILISLSKNIKDDIKCNCEELDNYLSRLTSNAFDSVYEVILSLKNTDQKAYDKLYPYFYYHYC